MPAGLKIAWGPAYLPVTGGDFTYSLMFVARNEVTDEYWVVIRGTNPISLPSWFAEDFHVDHTRPFDLFVPGLDKKIQISDASHKGMKDLLSLQDPQDGGRLVDFLKGVFPGYLYVTGHSLGGTLVPPLFAYLNAILGTKPTMRCWSFAGLTTGNAEFADYINGLVTWDQWRIVNSLDVIPLMFWNKDGLYSIYDYDPKWEDLEPVLTYINHLFEVAKRHGYVQPGGLLTLPGTKVLGLDYVGELLSQHIHTTYLQLVEQHFPL